MEMFELHINRVLCRVNKNFKDNTFWFAWNWNGICLNFIWIGYLKRFIWNLSEWDPGLIVFTVATTWRKETCSSFGLNLDVVLKIYDITPQTLLQSFSQKRNERCSPPPHHTPHTHTALSWEGLFFSILDATETNVNIKVFEVFIRKVSL